MSQVDTIYMQIIVNNEKIEFEIQKKLNLNEIIEHLNEWASEKELYVTDYKIEADENLKPHELNSSNIEVMNVQIGDQKDLIETNLSQLNDYLDRIGSYLAGALEQGAEVELTEKQNLREGIDYIHESLSGIMQVMSGKDEQQPLKEKLDQLVDLDIEKDLEAGLNLLAVLKNQVLIYIKNLRLSRMSEEELINSKNQFLNNIDTILEKLEHIAEDLTIGKENVAITKLENITGVISDGLIILRMTNTSPEITTKMLAALNEMTTALVTGDMVTAADIVDFDLKDLLTELKENRKD